MSEEKKKGIYIESVRGGREVPTVAPPPTQRRKVTDGREVQRTMPAPPAPPPAAPIPTSSPTAVPKPEK